jgi:hypothetical protein
VECSGKTFSAEATSEHVRRPLYVIGGGDLGTKAIELDAALERVFDLATMWKAIVLIDEVSAYHRMFVRGAKTITRRMCSWINARTMIQNEMRWWPSCKHEQHPLRVAHHIVYRSLRHLEYFRGIMFLATNRIKAFDQAFLSRIHIALRFEELSHESKMHSSTRSAQPSLLRRSLSWLGGT